MTVVTLHAARAGRIHRVAFGARTRLAVLGAALGLLLARPASAQSGPPLNNAQIAEAMHTYFGGEKGAGPILFGPGLAGIAAGTVMVFRGDEVTRGAGFPMLGLGLAQTIVGTSLLLATDKRVAKFDAALAKDPVAWKRDESKRMAGVNTTLLTLMIVESVFIVGGTVTAVVASQKDCCRTLKGVGIGLAAESAFTLVFDIFAKMRAQEYAHSLRRFEPSSGAMKP